ncbi:M-phase-specific PLK1-interacting protein [Momordica charantia]|uniref:M-phase-specific PLK1-interacting protein n=1 Tax=Momordica charantia TaxID=3673 RepID=A0A6J1D482_MOMCH|nr:M-phase-specific PLK1-interacting protein [Momordica charantia]
MSPSPTHQFHQHSPDQRMFHARGFNGSGCHGGPAIPRPFPMDRGTPGIWSGPRSPFVNQFPGHPPRGMSSPRSPFVNHFPSHPPRDMSSPSIVPGPRGNSYTNPMQDRVNYHTPSPSSGYEGSPSPGRGSHGFCGNMTPTSRFGSGRGSSYHGRHFSSNKSLRPEHFPFYNESMLDDPWKDLQPGIWRTTARANSSESWISRSRMKKARVSEPFSSSSSQPSLAEYLAASFNEAVDDAPSV